MKPKKQPRTPKAKVKPVRALTYEDRLYNAAAAYIKKRGGTAVVAGPIQILHWPGDLPNQYGLVVKILGVAPKNTVPGK